MSPLFGSFLALCSGGDFAPPPDVGSGSCGLDIRSCSNSVRRQHFASQPNGKVGHDFHRMRAGAASVRGTWNLQRMRTLRSRASVRGTWNLQRMHTLRSSSICDDGLALLSTGMLNLWNNVEEPGTIC